MPARPTRPTLLLLLALVALAAYLGWPRTTADPAIAPPTTHHTAGPLTIADDGKDTAPLPGAGREVAPAPEVESFALRGLTLADPAMPLTGAAVHVFAGRSNARGLDFTTFFSAMEEMSRDPRAALHTDLGAPIAIAPLAADGTFRIDGLRTRHVLLVLDHDHYALSQPRAVHIHTDRETYVVLEPYLGAHLFGRVLGLSETGTIRLTSEPDLMSLMKNPGDFMGNMIGQTARSATIGDDGRFEFRAVLPTHVAHLHFQSAAAAVRFGPTSLRPGQTREVVLRTQPCGSLHATVRDAGGAGVEHARVALQPLDTASIQASAIGTRAARTARDGTCTVDAILPGPYLAKVTAPGLVGTTREVAIEPGAQARLELRLDPGGVVRGTVVDSAGQPIEGARVAYMQALDVPVLGDLSAVTGPDILARAARTSRIHSDAEGRFTLAGIDDPDPFCVAAWHVDHVAALHKGVRTGATDVVIRMQRPARIKGVVLDDATGAPVPAFSVETLVSMALVMERPTASTEVAGTSDAADGRFDLREVPPGNPTLRIRAAGYADLRKPVEVLDGADVDTGTLRLVREATVRGVVVDAEGTPVKGATVARYIPGLMNNPILRSMSGAPTGTTDDAGRFELAGLPAGATRLIAQAQGHASGTSSRFDLAAGQVLEGVELALTRGGTVRGHLRLAAGMSARGWLVLLGNQQGGSMASTYAGDDGAFEFRHIDPGRYDVNAMLESRMNEVQSSKLDMLRPGHKMDIAGLIRTAQNMMVSTRCRVKAGEVTEVELDGLDFGEAGVSVTFRVTLGDRPLAAGLLEVERLDTGELIKGFVEDGTGTVPSMQPGRIRVQVRTGLAMTPVGEPVVLEIPKGSRHSAHLRLPGGAVHGRVVDAETGEPLHHAIVRIVSAAGAETDQVEEIGFATTDAEGRFRFDGLGEGRYSVFANASFFAAAGAGSTGRAEGIQVSGESSREVLLRAHRAARATILVSGPDGRPRNAARVYAVDKDGKPLSLLPARTDETGEATLLGLPAGDVRLVVLSHGLVPGFSAVRDLEPRRETRYRVELTGGPRVRIRIESATGTPLGEARLSARWNDGPWIPVSLIQKFDPHTKRVDVGHLPPGRVEFRVHHAGAAPFIVSRDLPAGPAADLVFTAPK